MCSRRSGRIGEAATSSINVASLAKMHRCVISLRALTEVSKVNGNQVFTVNKKLVSLRPSYMIKDVEGRLLGRTIGRFLLYSVQNSGWKTVKDEGFWKLKTISWGKTLR
jgi:uncharacterized protein YxjI